MVDPPWPKKKGGLRTVRPNQSRSLDYKTMSVDEIFELLKQEIIPQACEDHCLFVWTIDQFLSQAESRLESLGYKRHARIVWDKENGVAPCFTVRYSHEYLLWYYKEKLTQISLESRGKYTTVFREKPREHSRKPNAAYAMIDKLYPSLRKCDVFSREKREGWDQFGDEPTYFR